MGSSAPAAIDYVDSHARLRGTDVEVVLCGLAEDVGDRTALVLSRGGSTISAPAQVRTTGEVLEVRARTPRNGLADGYWAITLAADESLTIDARLLVQGSRPVVLVLGASAPPSTVPATIPETASPTARQRAARAGGKILDRALRVLPADRAARARERARSLARSVLH